MNGELVEGEDNILIIFSYKREGRREELIILVKKKTRTDGNTKENEKWEIF